MSDGLLERAERAFAGAPDITAAFARVRAIIGPSAFPNGEELAQQAMDALRKGIVPSPAQRAALESVIKAMRPSILSQKGSLGPLPPYRNYPPGATQSWDTFRAAVKPYLYSIGRIDRINMTSGEPIATGFLIARNLLVTNKHVLEALSAGTLALEKGQAVVRFGQEWGVVPDGYPPVAIIGVKAVHPDLDVVVLEIERTLLTPLSVDTVAAQPGRQVVAIGYPQDDPRSPVFRDVIFEDKYKVKRAAPGEITGVAADAVYHDCSTLGGNSGSPIVAMDTARVVGLHRDGPLFLYHNEAVDAPSLGQFVQPYIT